MVAATAQTMSTEGNAVDGVQHNARHPCQLTYGSDEGGGHLEHF